MHAKQIKNIQLKNYQTKCRSVFRNSNDNLISIANLLAISVHYFEIFSRPRHLYDFPILRRLKYKTTS